MIWCTGFRNDYSWIRFPVPLEDGWYPVQERGAVPSSPGLYFVGLPFLHSFSSMLILGAGRDAERVVKHLVSRASEGRAVGALEERPLSPRDGTGGCGSSEPSKSAADDDLDSADDVLVWNGMVASIHRIPCDDAPATTPTRPAEATEPIRNAPTGGAPGNAARRAERRIAISLPSREREPERVVAHLGPTNSGKTHAALDELVAKGAGVYAGPLRMLAQEAHRRLGERVGFENVALVTGEERVNEGASIVCCTVEMAPQSGELLVLDEIQWADDDERGSAWTRLMLAGEYREILLLGALDALPLVERAFPEAELKVFERMLPLEWVGERTLRSLGTGTVIVAFSRKAVLALAGEVNRLHPGRVAVLYGAMPLASRREEIDRFVSGAADVCVATDVLGHGVNLPCETLLFAETTKFDGEERRNLLPWEIAQIAGRAGRFGLVERGHVGVLSGLGWGTADPDIVESALEPHVRLPGGYWGYRIVDEARIRPRLSDLGVDDPRDLDAALVAWHRVAVREWASESWLAVESLQPLRLRLDAVQRRLAQRGQTPLSGRFLEARQRARGRGQCRPPGNTCSRDRRRSRRTTAPDVPPRHDAAARRASRGCRAGRKGSEHPALVRAAVSRRRRRHDRACGGARGSRSGPRGLPTACGSRIAHARALSLVAGAPALPGSRSASAAPELRRGRDNGSSMTVDELRALPLFTDVSDAGLARLAECVAELERDPGQVIALPDDPGTGCSSFAKALSRSSYEATPPSS